MNKKKTLKKIKALFALRRIPELLEISGLKKNGAFAKKLYRLQDSIYQLDDYLESNWKLKKTEANKYWKDIYSVMKDLGYNRKQAIELTKDIQRYQDFEWSLRNGMPKNKGRLYSTYRIKSCDVTLMRKLISLESTKGKKAIQLADWRYFDLLTEVADDIQDLQEDCKIYNGNRFMISLLQNGKGKTNKIYSSFLNEINVKAKARFKKDKKNPINGWISNEYKSTRALLKSQIKNASIKSLKKSDLAKKVCK